MRQLRSCDFCGEDASGIYEVLPAELSPTEDEQRRVVLCDDCLRTLETVVDPLLARLGFDAAASRDSVVEKRERGESPEPVSASRMSNREGDITERPIATSAKDTTDATPMTTESERTSRTADGGTDDEGAAHGETADVDDEGAVEQTGDEETGDEETFGDRPAEDYEVDEEAAVEETATPDETRETTSESDEERTVEETDDEETFGDRPAEDYEVDDADRRQSTEGDPAEDYEVEGDVEAGGEMDAAESIEAEPEKFRRVMRLLNNRDLPVERDEFADVATGAYELDRSEVDAIIDYGIERDVLAEEDGRLRKAS
ncbi:hypothetical protein C474_09874 [Halogeometricum pallidum JCM 14848]|uniref:Uncharacterized protein n=2 Tax=Halogeometricum TaxID=60846 RepID=M0DAE3_HALPD|nr:hypothetical protein C474_09874 [Halogeometricum pallidum JCM 14848]